MVAIVASAIAIAAIFATNNLAQQINKGSGTDLQTAGAEQFCQTKEEAQAIAGDKIQVKEPTYLPAGYKPICADGSPDTVLLFYGDGRALAGEKANRNVLLENGAVLIATKRFDKETDQAFLTRDKKAEIEHMFTGVNPDIKSRLTKINENIAAVREQCQDCGKSFITYQNGTSIQTGTYGLSSIIVFYDWDQQYWIEAYRPSQELERIANSLT